MPTLDDSFIITRDTNNFLLKHFGREWNEKDSPSKALAPASLSFGNKEFNEDDLPDENQRKTVMGIVGNLSDEEKRALISEVLTPIGHNLMVTPKEIGRAHV